jgi:hypothetical protein
MRETGYYPFIGDAPNFGIVALGDDQVIWCLGGWSRFGIISIDGVDKTCRCPDTADMLPDAVVALSAGSQQRLSSWPTTGQPLIWFDQSNATLEHLFQSEVPHIEIHPVRRLHNTESA